jgi:hypothetical protein
MKFYIAKYLLFSVLCVIMIVACNEPMDTEIIPDPIIPPITKQDSVISSPPKTNSTCNLIAYSDTLIYLKYQKDDLKIKPLQRRDGEYGAIPEGLEINNSNGEINVTKSETGLKYKVFFIPKNTSDTCFTSLTISGIDYLSKIYVLDLNDTLVVPVYNSNPNNTLPGGRKNANPQDSGKSGGSEFDDDDDDDNGDGTLDEPLPGQQVILQGMAIDKANGKIQLKKSLKNGLLGSNPSNGSSKKFKIFYRLDDNSGKALNSIEVQFHYYSKSSDVPKDLLDNISGKNQTNSGGRIKIEGNFNNTVRKPRPPNIVIVGRYQ